MPSDVKRLPAITTVASLNWLARIFAPSVSSDVMCHVPCSLSRSFGIRDRGATQETRATG